MSVQLFTMHADGHHHLLHGGVACALPEAVDSAFDLRCPIAHSRKRKCGGHAEIVVAMHRNRNIIDAIHVFHKVFDTPAKLIWH